MKLFLLSLVHIFTTRAQETWETLYTNFQGNDPNDAQGWIIYHNYNEKLFTTCNVYELFGGYNAFGMNTIVLKQFNLPPHYQINITLEFWKIDCWDYDTAYIITENTQWSKSYTCKQGNQLCGGGPGSDEYIESITFAMDHYSESLIFIVTTDLDYLPNDESWGLRNFSISILRCPLGCISCQDNNFNNCYYWIGFLSLWYQSIELDGWVKNNDIQPKADKCVIFDIVGGYLNLAPNDKLGKLIENLPPHFQLKVQFQLWLIDLWNNEMFFLEIDDQIQNQTILKTTDKFSICGSKGLEKIINIGIILNHSQSQCNITMRTNHNAITTIASWGIRAFNIYLAKCFNGCDQCTGPLKTQCTVCSDGWVFYHTICTYPPPIFFSQIQITQIQDLNSDERIHMEIKLLEVNKQIINQGSMKLSVYNNQPILTIQVYAKCIPNSIMKSKFQSNTYYDSQFYQFQQNCQRPFNLIIYSVQFQLSIIGEQVLIIDTSDSKCLIYQVVQFADEFIQIKILDILLENI
ncbi:unnamed protein product [Paramecium sonneborni]|uniref:Uncharacterized protein n=1 Tax=Paramecium sonneborni TaxID=65129 RepID=A0A8S1QL47_9CILI|nr:unnamed protein product [Paramecium sonneborni]